MRLRKLFVCIPSLNVSVPLRIFWTYSMNTTACVCLLPWKICVCTQCTLGINIVTMLTLGQFQHLNVNTKFEKKKNKSHQQTICVLILLFTLCLKRCKNKQLTNQKSWLHYRHNPVNTAHRMCGKSVKLGMNVTIYSFEPKK